MFDYVYTLSDLSAISLLSLPLAKPSSTAEKKAVSNNCRIPPGVKDTNKL